ncbi:hypothetical protein LINGRAHAP2_LOCUS18100 [Linum grandiflorum]
MEASQVEGMSNMGGGETTRSIEIETSTPTAAGRNEVGKEKDVMAGGSDDSCELAAVQSKPYIGDVCGASWRAYLVICFHRHFLRPCHRIHLVGSVFGAHMRSAGASIFSLYYYNSHQLETRGKEG